MSKREKRETVFVISIILFIISAGLGSFFENGYLIVLSLIFLTITMIFERLLRTKCCGKRINRNSYCPRCGTQYYYHKSKDALD